MIATIMGPEGFPLSRERVEWMLAPDGVGELVSPGERRPLEVLNWLRGLPRKVDTSYAINTTLAAATALDRGTPTPTDDILVQNGQAWVSVTSPTEGTSRLTVFAPGITGWDRRQQSASIYWVDAQWRFPPPAISAAGSRNTLTTLVTRSTDNSPLAGWVVRYEVAGGPQAGFAPDGAAAVEVVTGPAGEAPAEILQRQAAAGTNQINIQVISPAGPAGPNRQLAIGTGATFQTWTSGEQPLPYSGPSQPPVVGPQPPVVQPQPPAEPARRAQLEVTISGPTTAVVESDVQFDIQVVNRGTAPATNILVSNRFDPGLEHAKASGLIERDVIDLPPGGVSRLSATFHVSRAGQLCQDITVTADGDVRATARSCITATASPLSAQPQPRTLEQQPPPAAPEPRAVAPTPATTKLSVTKKGPDRRSVGETALFVIEVTNQGEAAIENLQIADNFETSLEPSRATEGSQWFEGNALGWKIASLAPGGRVRREIELKCLRPTPRSCNRVTVTAPGLEPLADEACLEIVGDGDQSPPAADAQSPPAADAQAAPAAGAEMTVSIADTADPIKVDGQTTCQIVLANKGQQSAFEVEVSVKFSDELRFEGSNGPVRGSVSAGVVRFTPIRELRSGEKGSFELRFNGARPGTGRVQVDVTSQGQARPISAEQTTEVLR
ncbi:MAG: hypothetical protein WD063_12425 [Pirellulales bacterium]